VKLFAHHDREIDYAKEAIETTRRTFAREMRLFTIMDVVLTVLNGLLIVAVVGWAVWLWAGDAATVGTVAAATALTLRLNAMTGWIMWAVSSFFRSLGVVAEGMETIAQPITLTDAPAPAARFRHGRDRVRRRLAPLRARRGRARPSEPDDPSRREGRPDRTLRRGQVDPGEAAPAVLRRRGGRILIDGQDIADVTQDSLRHRSAWCSRTARFCIARSRQHPLRRPEATRRR
jgi:ATP-binding cassette subfamily B multidrug efflux pump